MRTKVKVIGLGGIGSHLADPLCRYLNYATTPAGQAPEVTLVDGDRYEERNQDRQQFDRCDGKAIVSSGTLRRRYPRLDFRHKDEYVTEANVVALVREHDLVFLCVDNHATRRLVSDRCGELEDVTLISGGNETTDGNVIYYARRDGRDVTRSPTALHPAIAHPADTNPGDGGPRRGCQAELGGNPQLLFTNLATASAMLNVYLAHSRGEADFEQVFFDILTQRSRPTPEHY